MNTHPDHTPTTAAEPARNQRRSSPNAVIITMSIIGGVILLALIITALFTFTFARGSSNQTVTQDVTGVSALDVSVSAGDFTLEFGAVDEAELEVRNGRGEWTMRQAGETLVVHSPRQPWLNLCFGWCDHQEVTLTLPNELQRSGDLDAALELSAGRLHATGEFNHLAVDLSAGEITVNGSSNTLESQVSAGELNGSLTDVATGQLQVSAGSTELTLDGRAPDQLTLNVSAGSIDLTLPDAEYDLHSDVSAGSLDNKLRTSSSSPHRIDADVSAGSITLRG